MLKWTPDLAVGIVEIDEQHQELFRRAERFVASLGTADWQEIGICSRTCGCTASRTSAPRRPGCATSVTRATPSTRPSTTGS